MECMLPDGSFTTDFVYEGHRIAEGAYESDCGLPFATDGAQTLTVWHLILYNIFFKKSRIIFTYLAKKLRVFLCIMPVYLVLSIYCALWKTLTLC